ncbi:hypothetical protein L204_101991 [Cryptococcus depauperatus]
MSHVADAFWQPFSQSALKLLPKRGVGFRAKSKRADRIPDDPQRSLVTDYHSINDPSIRIHKKFLHLLKSKRKYGLQTSERSSPISLWVYCFRRLPLASFLALETPRPGGLRLLMPSWVLVYGWAIFQKRLTMISAREAGNFDFLWGPLIICAALFVAVLANFIFRFHEVQRNTGVNPLSFQNAWQQTIRTNLV